jgi:hypothetical protein
MGANLRNVAFKAFWTGVSAALGFIVVWLASAPYAWAPLAIVVINVVLAYTRERTGETTPTLAGPGVGPQA